MRHVNEKVESKEIQNFNLEEMAEHQHPKYERMPSRPSSSQKFIPGIKLNRMFFEDVVKPLMDKYFPNLKYSAALTGHGSDVLGFDNERSQDHNWGPHLVMFFRYNDYGTWAPRVDEMLRKCLPYTYKGFSTNFSNTNPDSYLKNVPVYINSGDVNHLFSLFSIRGFLRHYLGFDRDREIQIYDWLTFPEQALLEVTSGPVYYDGLGELEPMRKKFAYYPRDIWLYALRVQWGKIANELQYQARTGENGDEIGSHILASRMNDMIMKMAFLMERKYAPYRKWLGTAFKKKLKYGKKLLPILMKAEHSTNWETRQEYLAKAYVILAQMHNSLGITDKIPVLLTKFPGRGYRTLDVSTYIHEIEKQIQDSKLRNMKYVLGTVDQFIDHARINHENYVYRHMQDLIE